MSTLRIVWKLPAIFITCATSAGWLAVLRTVAVLLPTGQVERENRLVRTWARSMSRIVGMRVSSEGPAPQSDFLLVSNHISYIDVLAYMSQVDARLLSKAEVKGWPLIGSLASFGGTLFVDRTKRRDLPRVIQEIRGTLEQGRGVVFFPEGTSSSGMDVRDFRASLFEVAVKGSLPISTAAIRYECHPDERPAQWSIAWWGDMPFASHFLAMLRLSEFKAHIVFNEESLHGEDRKQLASRAQCAVEDVFVPLCTELGPDELFGEGR